MPFPVNAVILDMDNTLYDWISYFVPAIRAMLSQASRLLDVDQGQLREDLRTVHVARGNVEHPFALLETRSVAKQLPNLTRSERYEVLKPAFAAFNEVRNMSLQLYPGVAETLQAIKNTGCRLLGHTEATDINITTRMRTLGLHSVFEAIYAPQSIGLGHPLGNKREHHSERVPIRRLSSSARKPDPAAVQQILRDISIDAGRCLYVGDSLAKDITMAKHVGMLAAWARYGTRNDPGLWRDLVDISHWDAASVAAAKSSVPDPSYLQPDVTLDSFSELLIYFRFSAA